MPKTFDLAEFIKKTPTFDHERLKAGLKLAAELRRIRSKFPRGPRVSPLVRRRVRILDDLSSDPRLVQLSSLRRRKETD